MNTVFFSNFMLSKIGKFPTFFWSKISPTQKKTYKKKGKKILGVEIFNLKILIIIILIFIFKKYSARS
jgi:hypothetical protein